MSLIYGLLGLLIIFFAGAMVLGIIMYAKESVLNNVENTGNKLYNPSENAITECLKCGQKLNAQHTFCPYCGNEKDKQREVEVKNIDAMSNIETESDINIKNDTEENSEVIDTSSDNDLDINLNVDSSKIENTELDPTLNEDDVNSSIKTLEVEAEDSLKNGNINVLEDIYQSQNRWLNGDKEKVEDIASVQEEQKDSNYKHNKRKNRKK